MTYLFIHISPDDAQIINASNFVFNKIPNYYFQQMIHTASIDNTANIFFICNKNNIQKESLQLIENVSNIHIVDYNNYLDDQLISAITKYGKICYDLDKITLYKFPMMYKFMIDNNISEALYQEADVSIYTPFNDVRKYFNSNYITTCSYSAYYALLSGIFYANNTVELYNLTIFIIDTLKNNQRIADWSIVYDYYCNTKKINILPCLPFETDQYIFDPNSYGQYLGGDTHQKTPGFIDGNHKVSKEFLIPYANDFRIFKDSDNLYKLFFKDKTYVFYNLHIHNKDRIEQFIQ